MSVYLAHEVAWEACLAADADRTAPALVATRVTTYRLSSPAPLQARLLSMTGACQKHHKRERVVEIGDELLSQRGELLDAVRWLYGLLLEPIPASTSSCEGWPQARTGASRATSVSRKCASLW